QSAPREVFDEILQRLPLKDIHRCKCVSKRWLNWISSPYFVRSYIQFETTINPSPPLALFYQVDAHSPNSVDFNPNLKPNPNEIGISFTSEMPIFSQSRGFSLNFLPHPNPLVSSSTAVAAATADDQQQQPAGGLGDHLRLLASNNGLVLCSPSVTSHRVYYVCNPLTMQWVELPPPPTFQKHIHFGFTTRIDVEDFKKSSFRVVRICSGDKLVLVHRNTLNLEIFSSETGTWTESLISCPHEPFFGSFCAVDYKGMLYWRFKSIFFGFDPYNPSHPHRPIDMPKGYHARNCKHAQGVCNGHLMFAQFGGYTLTIWELNDNYSSDSVEWSVVHKLQLKVQSLLSPLTVVAFHPFDRDILCLWSPGCIMDCNMRRSKFETSCRIAHSRASNFLHHLVSPFVLPGWPTSVPALPY
ncbi:F-box protein At3g26010-like, partial [Cornus florida]|uniref:F-box protein At3g26010-like n=1 Tax=Cornus florida TaxID=4283 RepID=UPI0028A09943